MPRLGQHFLKKTSATNTIVNALNLKTGETVIEIGPGTGVLTWPLLKRCNEVQSRLIVIERDPKLADELAEKNSNLNLIRGDALKVIPQILKNHNKEVGQMPGSRANFKVVGNIPYYITGALLRMLGELNEPPIQIVIMIQKEVAERLVAKPPRMNLLAAATGYWAESQILETLAPEDFSPPPKVSSAIVSLRSKPQKTTAEREAYYRFIKAIFRQPRKTILNNLKSAYGQKKEEAIKEVLLSQGLSGLERPQNISLEILTALSTCVAHMRIIE